MNLRGYDPSGAPLPPAEAIRGFLDALGVAASRVPLPVGLCRSRLCRAGRLGHVGHHGLPDLPRSKVGKVLKTEVKAQLKGTAEAPRR